MSMHYKPQTLLVLIVLILSIIIAQQVSSISLAHGLIVNTQKSDPLTLIEFMDFNESTIDENIWNFNIGNGCPNLCGWGNRELQYYTRENAFIENGNLVIEARKEKYIDPLTNKEYEYTSARLDTIGKLKITPPVRIEVRAKLPKGKGLWPAIWLIGEEWSLNNVKAWPSCGEIDIMELIGQEPNTIYGTVHAPYCYGSRGVGSHFKLPKGMDFSQDYHVFGIEWTNDYIIWFVDDQIYHILTRTEFEKHGCKWVFDKPFHLVLNIAVGGYWPGNPDETTQFPARMYIDWIKIYRVNKPSYAFTTDIVDSYNEVVAKTRGFPKASLETIVNGDFSKPIDFKNSPITNPDEWYVTGRLDLIDERNTVVENGVLKLTIKPPGPGPAEIKLGQVIWIYQNTSYIIRVRAWSSIEEKLVIRVSLPIYPPKILNETIVKLTTEPRYYELRLNNPPWGSNTVEIALLYNGTIYKDLTIFIDEVEICRINTCKPITETTTTPPLKTTIETTTTQNTAITTATTTTTSSSITTTSGATNIILVGASTIVLIVILAVIAIIVILYMLISTRRKS